ncbi:DUF1403 family protein [Ochrobactrum oryzae]|nr:DUF1403 family protein [Brucella oryzae]NKC23592.1 DUF1403 family protein [Brucella oryzae]
MLAVAPKLRAKGADAIVDRLLNEDALMASRGDKNGQKMSDRGYAACSTGFLSWVPCVSCPVARPSAPTDCDDGGSFDQNSARQWGWATTVA